MNRAALLHALRVIELHAIVPADQTARDELLNSIKALYRLVPEEENTYAAE